MRCCDQVSWSENRLFKDGARFQAKFTGEAVTLDLGGGRYLFALLGHSENSEYIARLAPSIFEKTAGLQWGDATFKAAEEASGPIPVPPSLYPMLVTFGDIADPKTVRRVEPLKFATSFGAGHALKSITLEITNEAVTRGVLETVLTWLSKYPEPPLCKPTSGIDFSFCAASVRHGDFIRR